MKNKWLARLAFLCAICALVYIGYGIWNNFLDEQEKLVGAEWVVPLSEDYNYWNDYIRLLNNDLEEINLELMLEENKNYDEDFSFSEKLCGVKDSQGKIIIPPIYERLNVDAELGYILAGNDDTKKYHYYKIDGTDFIKGDFQDASIFENGYACVQQNKEKLVISATGEKLLEIKPESIGNIEIFDSTRGLLKFWEEEYNSDQNRLEPDFYGLMNLNGNIVLEPKYDIIEKNKSGNRILAAKYTNDYQYHEGVYLNNNFTQISKEHYKHATNFEQGLAVVKDNVGWCIINEDEEVIARIEGCIEMNGFSEGIAAAEFRDEIKYFDKSGKVLFAIPNTGFNQRTTTFSDGKIVFEGENKKWGYMDSKGNVLIKPMFDRADSVENGEAFVKIGKKAGVIKF